MEAIVSSFNLLPSPSKFLQTTIYTGSLSVSGTNPPPQFHGLLRKPSALRFSARHSCLEVRRVSYRPPGTQQNLLNDISFALQEKSFGLIFGRSGSGKTTLLQLPTGLAKPTSGSIYFQSHRSDGNVNSLPESLSSERVGIVFQFPERYFLADTVLEEVTFGWPRQKADFAMRQQLALNLQYAINSAGLNTISLDEDPHSSSGGYKRRLALAIQLVQKPDLLLLDEPLAGLGMNSTYTYFFWLLVSGYYHIPEQ